MTIAWYGEGCFKIQSGDTVILTDPFESSTGLTPPRLKADIILKTINPFPPVREKNEGAHLVLGSGEYNIKNINILGFPIDQESTEKFLKTIYLALIENINLCFLGHISEAPVSTIFEHINEVDILFIPGGGKPFIDQKSAIKIVKTLEPKIVIPSFFKVPGLKRSSSDLKSFLEEFNHKSVESQEKLTIKRKDISEIKSTRIVALKN